MRYQIQHGIVQYAANTILKDINFEIHDKEKIGIVGRNGCGKTTLLKLITGELELANLDSDENSGITMSGKQYIGYLHQTNYPDGSVTVEEEIKKAFSKVFETEKRMREIEAILDSSPSNTLLKEYDYLQSVMDAQCGYTWKQDMEIMFQKFGFPLEDLKRPIGTFSGGQQTKIAFIKLLLERPDILLLDEPTNHLDMKTIQWLEDYLREYNKAVVIVSHDRAFLDKITTVTYEIEYHKMRRFKGNYSYYVSQKELLFEQQEKAYIAQQKEIERLKTWIEKWKNTPTKATQARSKQKELDHMDIIEKPRHFDTKVFKSHFSPKQESYHDVITADKLKIGYDKELSEVSFTLHKYDRLAVIGENGQGKSTLLKTLVNKIKPLGGHFIFGSNVDMAYFDQQVTINDFKNSQDTVLDNFWERFPTLSNKEARSALGAFMFSQEEVDKKLCQLSGGEKVRLALCKLFYTRPNLLILDEPTNHMDIIGKEALEQMLVNYEGTVLFVSHDRYFIDRVATCILDFETDKVTYYDSNYSKHLQEKQKQKAFNDNINPIIIKKDLQKQEEKKKYINPGKTKSKLQRQVEKHEKELEEIDEMLTKLENDLSLPEISSNYEKLIEIQNEIDSLHDRQDSILNSIVDAETEIEKIDALDYL